MSRVGIGFSEKWGTGIRERDGYESAPYPNNSNCPPSRCARQSKRLATLGCLSFFAERKPTLWIIFHCLVSSGGIAQWQSIRLQIERSPVQLRVPPTFFCPSRRDLQHLTVLTSSRNSLFDGRCRDLPYLGLDGVSSLIFGLCSLVSDLCILISLIFDLSFQPEPTHDNCTHFEWHTNGVGLEYNHLFGFVT